MNRIKARLAMTAIAAAVVSVNAQAVELVEKVETSFPFGAQHQTLELESVAAYSATEIATYTASKGERLKDILSRWTRTVGYDLVWQPKPEDGDLRLAGSIEFEDSFFGASESLFKVLREQSPFDAQIHPNQVLRVFLANSKQ